jgi:hypothetical protein
MTDRHATSSGVLIGIATFSLFWIVLFFWRGRFHVPWETQLEAIISEPLSFAFPFLFLERRSNLVLLGQGLIGWSITGTMAGLVASVVPAFRRAPTRARVAVLAGVAFCVLLTS